MKIKLTQTEKKEVEVDVEFPIYRNHDVTPDYRPSSVWYYRIEKTEKGMREVGIHIDDDDGSVTVEIDDNYTFDQSNLDYLLGRGIYESDREEFENAVQKAKEVINSI